MTTLTQADTCRVRERNCLCFEHNRSILCKLARIGKLSQRAPSFRGLSAASAVSSRAKQANRAVNTHHERVLRQNLRRLGLHFQNNVRNLPGKPDIVFFAAKVAVFCDGDFWHGHHWQSLKQKLCDGTNSSYWIAKIATNRRRDKRANVELRKAGWRVLRFWEKDILKHPARAAQKVHQAVISDLHSHDSLRKEN